MTSSVSAPRAMPEVSIFDANMCNVFREGLDDQRRLWTLIYDDSPTGGQGGR
jgi:hypothetical protein